MARTRQLNKFFEQRPGRVVSSVPGVTGRRELAEHLRLQSGANRRLRRRADGTVIETTQIPVYNNNPMTTTRVVRPSGEEEESRLVVRLENARVNILNWENATLGVDDTEGNKGAVEFYNHGAYHTSSEGENVPSKKTKWEKGSNGKNFYFDASRVTGFVGVNDAKTHVDQGAVADLPINSTVLPNVFMVVHPPNYIEAGGPVPGLATHFLMDMLYDVQLVEISKNKREVIGSKPTRFSFPYRIDPSPEKVLLDVYPDCELYGPPDAPVICSLNGISSDLLPNAGTHCCDYMWQSGVDFVDEFGVDIIHPIPYGDEDGPGNEGWDTVRQNYFEIAGHRIYLKMDGITIVSEDFDDPGVVYIGSGFTPTGEEMYYDNTFERRGYPLNYDYGDAGWPVQQGTYEDYVPMWKDFYDKDTECLDTSTVNRFWTSARFSLHPPEYS